MPNNARCILTAVLIALPACASLPRPLTAQRLQDAPPAELLHRFASEEASPGGPHGASSAITYIFVHRADYSPATVHSLIDGLERLALESDNRNVRHSSARYLSVAGYISNERPEPGLLARLKQVYARTTDPEVRVVVVTSMGQLAERREAVAFLEKVAKQDPASEDFPNAALWALRTLPGMGDEGRAALKSLHDSKAVRHPEARHGLDVLAEKGYKIK
jgi:HEAT repeat protein